jgi:hypothetical protein
VLLVNSDALLGPDCLERLEASLAIPRVGLAHALRSNGTPRVQGVRAVVRGVRYHLRGRYGESPVHWPV